MGLIERAQRDAKRFTTNTNHFGVTITMTRPATALEAEVTAEVKGYHIKHHTSWDPESGEVIDGKRAHIAVSESELTEQGYPVRNSNGEVALLNDYVTVSDSSGVDKQYITRQTFPDETLGLIVMILSDFDE